jgi:hypothetical protein
MMIGAGFTKHLTRVRIASVVLHLHHQRLATTVAKTTIARITFPNNYTRRMFVSQTTQLFNSPFGTNANASVPTKSSRARSFVPQKAAVQLTERARTFFKGLLNEPPRPDVIGIRLNYDQSSTGEPRMVFSFEFVTAQDLGPNDEPVSLEVMDDEFTPKPYAEAWNDGLPKLYVNGHAFLKVLGSKVDVDLSTLTLILYDREGNVMDPNA